MDFIVCVIVLDLFRKAFLFFGLDLDAEMWNLARVAASVLSRSRRFSTAIPGPCMVHKRGTDILHDPWFNKVIFSFFFYFFSCLLSISLLVFFGGGGVLGEIIPS